MRPTVWSDIEVIDANEGLRESLSTIDSSQMIEEAILEALQVTVPAWPLQNTVAVSPFWNLRSKAFEDIAYDLPAILHHSLFMPIGYYLEKFQKGTIRPAALERVLKAARNRKGNLPTRVDLFTQYSSVVSEDNARYLSFIEYFDEQEKTNWQHGVDQEVGKFAGSYFDRSQALIKFPWQNSPFWQAWCQAQAYDRSLEILGLDGFRAAVADVKETSPQEYIVTALTPLAKAYYSRLTAEVDPDLNPDLNVSPDPSRVYNQTKQALRNYLSRLLVQSFGWASQFQWHTWQQKLGRQESLSSSLGTSIVDLLAVRLAYDQIFANLKGFQGSPVYTVSWAERFFDVPRQREAYDNAYEIAKIWQEAFELSSQTRYGSMIRPIRDPSRDETDADAPLTSSSQKSEHKDPQHPDVQVVMCIDVRSELLRRQLENTSPKIATIGFAGFFGVPIDYKQATDKNLSYRLPVLLGPSMVVEEEVDPVHTTKRVHHVLFDGFFKNLRKAPLSSFLYVEIFGLFTLAKILKLFWRSLSSGPAEAKIPPRFVALGRRPSQVKVCTPKGVAFDLEARVDRAFFALRHMGLTKGFANIIVICGHGSATTNNLFGAALECGACGGHAGDINARFVVDLLNDVQVRAGLGKKGCFIPESTIFIAAIHETVSDSLFLLEDEKAQKLHPLRLETLKKEIQVSCQKAQKERQTNRSLYLDDSPVRRMNNWSEVRPEWGLAGNAVFIVAPRAMTRGAPLASRAFLHDYDWRRDEGFGTLELIMTAPMIVTHWINFQYYASTVVPKVYGAGNKLLHNLVNESGVLEGSGGDLKVGLPLQSVFDGEKFVHEPVRLAVMIAAPRDEIEKVIAKHQTVRELVDHGWLHLIHIEDEGDRVVLAKRRAGGHHETRHEAHDGSLYERLILD